VFVAADGVESVIARSAGLDNRLTLATCETFLQYHLGGIDVDRTCLEVYLGSQVAPGSYAWVFPRSPNEAAVGVGVMYEGSRRRPVRRLLDAFVERRFGGGEVLHTACGTSPRYMGEEILARGNLLVVGDAARVLDSLSGAGIANALLSGKMAGEACAAYLTNGNLEIEALFEMYPGRFLTLKQRELRFQLGLKKMISKFSDDELDDITQALADYFGDEPVQSVNLFVALAAITRKRPRLLKLARHLL
jgi:digeranylgeranylglycerophospholipid reductase